MPQPDQTSTIAFVTVRLGERSHAEALAVLADLSEAIDAVEGCAAESVGAFPESARDDVARWVDAARAVGAASDEEQH